MIICCKSKMSFTAPYAPNGQRVVAKRRYARFASAAQPAQATDDAPAGGLADFLLELHFTLGLGSTGQYLMGVVSVLYGLALLSGLLIHLPQLVGHLFALRPGRNLKRLWQDAHNAIGVLSLPFHLVFAVTGAALCLFAVVMAALNATAFDGRLFDAFARATATVQMPPASGVAAPMLPLDALVGRARAAAQAQGVAGFRPDEAATI